MSSGQKPRAVKHFPRMKDGGAGRLLRRVNQTVVAFDTMSAAAVAAVHSIEVMRYELELFGAVVARMGFATVELGGGNT